jgi:TolB protein
MLAALLLAAAPLLAQDTTRGVRIGLTYDPGSKPGVVVMPSVGAGGDSIRAILQRDLDFGDRVSVILLDAGADTSVALAASPNWALLAKLGGAAAVQVTPTQGGLHLAVYNVAAKQTALVRDYPAPPMTDARGWRAVLHGLSDDLEESLTGTRGIARTRVLFEREGRIWTVDADGEQAVPVTGAIGPLSKSWHPGGAMIAYSTYSPSQIVVRDLATGSDRTLASGSGIYTSPVFAPDGATVVYAHGVDEGIDLYVAPVAGGAGRKLTVGRGSENVSPSFSPDGRRIAFTSGRSGRVELYTIDADGSNVDLLIPSELRSGSYRASPSWSPDGRSIAFQASVGGTFQVMMVNLRTRRVRQLTSEGRNDNPSWAPDGRHLVFHSNRTGVRQLWVVDVETGRTRQLTHGSASRLPAWSPRLGT